MNQLSQTSSPDEGFGTNSGVVILPSGGVGSTTDYYTKQPILDSYDRIKKWIRSEEGVKSRATREEEIAYFKWATQAKEYFQHLASTDKGLMDPSGMGRLVKIPDCRYSPYGDRKEGNACGYCIVCKKIWSRKSFSVLNSELPPEIPWVSVILEIPNLEKDSAFRNISELLYIPPAILTGKAGKIFSTSQLLNGLRHEAVKAVSDCYPGWELGLVAFVHLEDRWLNFRPHIHIILSEVGFVREKSPLKLVNGNFPELKKSWRGLFRNCGLKEFRVNLRERWAERLADYLAGKFSGARKAFRRNIETSNTAYAVLPKIDLDAIGMEVRNSVMKDGNAIYVAKIDRHPQTQVPDRVAAKTANLRYNLKRSDKHTVFRQDGAREYATAMTSNTRGKMTSIGPLQGQYENLMRLLSVQRVSGYQRYGYLWSGQGRSGEFRAALLAQLSGGYKLSAAT